VKKERPVLNQLGQTSTEYLLLLVVMVTIITSLLSYIKSKYLGDLTQCDKKANQDTILCKISSVFEPRGNGKKFQYYRFK
jgi:uncharacterized protein (UPF0333 family)